MMSDSITPTVLWAQRKDRLFVSIQLDDVTEEQITVDASKLTFSGKSHNKTYHVSLEFFESIVAEESKQRKGGREFYFDLKKKTSGPYWPRILKETTKHQNIKVDFNRWLDEDEEDEGETNNMYDDASLEDMMQNMGTGSFDPGEVADSDDSDDDDMPDLTDSDGKKVE